MLSGGQTLPAQVKILSELNAGPSPRTIVGLLAEGPRLIGFNVNKLRLADQIRFGLQLDLAHLELLSGLVGGGKESDASLLE